MRRSLGLVLMLVCLFAACGDDGGAATGSSSTNPAGNTPDPVVGAEPLIWLRVRGSDAAFAGDGLYAEALAAGDPGLVVVGYEVDEDSSTGTYRNDGSRVWFSADGFIWEQLAYSGGGWKNWMHAVTAGGPGFVAVGEIDMGSDADPAVWVSEDGTDWTQSWTSSEEREQHVRAVAVGGPGLVAVGGTFPYGGPEDGESAEDAAVWVSTDGYSWDPVTDGASALGGDGNQVMYDVVAGGPGLVAVGRENAGTGSHGVVWTSPDGRAWTRVPDPAGVFGDMGTEWVVAVLVGDSGLVAVGDEGSTWTSPDGITWTRGAAGAVTFRGPGEAFADVAAWGPGFFSFGGGFVWLGVPCSSSEEQIAALLEWADGEIDDSACG